MARIHVNELMFRHLPRLAGGMVLFLGISVMAGWFEHWQTLIQVLPGFAPMKFNTALGFVFSGTSLILLSTRLIRLVPWLGLAAAAIGFLTLMEYLTGFSLGIDQWFVTDYIRTVTLFPGRMSQLAASCFAFLGLSLSLAGAPEWRARQKVVSGLLACIVAMIGMVVLLGYVFGVESATGWGAATHMALHTSVAFLLLGAGLLGWNWQAAALEQSTFLRWIPITASMTLMVMVATITIANMEELKTAAFWRQHTFKTILGAQSFENNLIDIQRGMRGYASTGDTNALASFQNARRLELQQLNDLVDLTRDNPGQQDRLKAVAADIHALLDYDNYLIAVYDQRGPKEVVKTDSTGQSRGVFGRTHDDLRSFSEEEQHLLDQRDATEQAKFHSAEQLLVLGSVMAALLLLLANLIAGRELSRRQQAEAKLEAQAEKLKRSNLELEQFAYVASHDMREPLRAVSGFAQILKRHGQEKLDARSHELIGHIVDGAKRMADIIDDLLALSRVGSQGKPFVNTDMGQPLAQALNNLSVVIRERAAVVQSDPLPALPVDGSQVALLFQNLVGNAVKFCDGRTPEVRISAVHDGNGSWQFSVRDNGIGIEPQYYERIFGIFQRLHTREEYPGTGIGLAICKKIVERHGGRIWLESAPGAGTTFFFSLPQHQKDHGEQSPH